MRVGDVGGIALRLLLLKSADIEIGLRLLMLRVRAGDVAVAGEDVRACRTHTVKSRCSGDVGDGESDGDEIGLRLLMLRVRAGDVADYRASAVGDIWLRLLMLVKARCAGGWAMETK